MLWLKGSATLAVGLAVAIGGAGWYVGEQLRQSSAEAQADSSKTKEEQAMSDSARTGGAADKSTPTEADGAEKVVKSDSEWRRLLTEQQYQVTRQKGTERAFSGEYWDTKTPGTYKCVCCGEPLFTSDAKFDSHCGWPSFYQPIAGVKDKRIEEHRDASHMMVRTEVTCRKCGAHLGHVFDDSPQTPTGLRYCINSASLKLEPRKGGDQPAGEAKK